MTPFGLLSSTFLIPMSVPTIIPRIARSARFLSTLFSMMLATHAAETSPLEGITTVRIAANLVEPLYVTAPPADGRRLFIVSKPGDILILNLETGRVNPTPFLSIPDVSPFGEGGLLGLAFSPDFASSGRFFVSYARRGGGRFVSAYQVSPNPDIADPATAQDVFRFGDNGGVHIGGWIGFRPGTTELWVTSGDGDALVPEAGHANLAQNPANPHGKIYRILPQADNRYAIPADNPWVNSSLGFRPEAWALGVRNPWRASFDRVTGDFWFGDVGGARREEINFEPAGSPGGRNYGWSIYEGNLATDWPGLPDPAGLTLTPPLLDYPHLGTNVPITGSSVTGGYVYRGQLVTALQGRYVFGDFINGRIFSLTHSGGQFQELAEHSSAWADRSGPIQFISSFGEDAAGELYIVSFANSFNPAIPGSLHRVVPAGPARLRWKSTPSPLTTLEVQTWRGYTYQFESSTDLDVWRAEGTAIVGTDDRLSHTVDLAPVDGVSNYRFWRVIATPWAP